MSSTFFDFAQNLRDADAALMDAAKAGSSYEALDRCRRAYVCAAVLYDESVGKIAFNTKQTRKNRNGRYSAAAMAANRIYIEQDRERMADWLIAKGRGMRELAAELAVPENAACLAKFAEGAALSFND